MRTPPGLGAPVATSGLTVWPGSGPCRTMGPRTHLLRSSRLRDMIWTRESGSNTEKVKRIQLENKISTLKYIIQVSTALLILHWPRSMPPLSSIRARATRSSSRTESTWRTRRLSRSATLITRASTLSPRTRTTSGHMDCSSKRLIDEKTNHLN